MRRGIYTTACIYISCILQRMYIAVRLEIKLLRINNRPSRRNLSPSNFLALQPTTVRILYYILYTLLLYDMLGARILYIYVYTIYMYIRIYRIYILYTYTPDRPTIVNADHGLYFYAFAHTYHIIVYVYEYFELDYFLHMAYAHEHR